MDMMPDELIISKIEDKDLEDLAALYGELVNEKTDIVKLRETYRRVGGTLEYIVLGAKVDGILIGSLMGIVCTDLIVDCRPFMYVDNVIVKNGYRGKGIGGKLLRKIEETAKQRDCYACIIISKSFREEAHRFYEKLGYRRDVVQGYKKTF
jgi:GNAT superfamily N-acetyltransferase